MPGPSTQSPTFAAESPEPKSILKNAGTSESPQKTTRESFIGWMKKDQAVWRDLSRFAEHIGASVGKVGAAPDRERAAADMRAAAAHSRRSISMPARKSLTPFIMESKYKRKQERRTQLSIAQKAKSLKYLVEIDPAMAKIKANLKSAAFYKGRFDWDHLFHHYDRDNSGHMGFDEFRQLVRRDARISPQSLSDDMLRDVFSTVDVDGGGHICIGELMDWVESGPSNLWEEIHLDSYLPIPPRRRGRKVNLKRPEKPLSKDEKIHNLEKEIKSLKQSLHEIKEGRTSSAEQTDAESPDSQATQFPNWQGAPQASPAPRAAERTGPTSSNRPQGVPELPMGSLQGGPVQGSMQSIFRDSMQTEVVVQQAEVDQYKASNVQDIHFGIQLSRVHDESLGLHLNANMIVEKVTWCGQVGDWNMRHPDKTVEAGDKVIEVNGKRGPEAIVKELKKQVKFDMFIARKPGGYDGDTVFAQKEQNLAELNRLWHETNSSNYSERKVYVEINRSNGENLGVDLSSPHLEVVAISWQGLIAKWNVKVEQPARQIRVGDRLIEANNHTGIEGILAECKRKALVNLVFLRRTSTRASKVFRKTLSPHIFEVKHLNPVWAKIKRNLRAHAYNFGGIDWNKIFHIGDRYDSGLLTFETFSHLVRKQGKMTVRELSDKRLQDVFAQLDEDASGEVELAEFTRWMGIADEKNAEESEDDSDAGNKTGAGGSSSSTKELSNVDKVMQGLRVEMFKAGSDNWPKKFAHYDREHKGILSFENFRQMIRMDFKIHDTLVSTDSLRMVFNKMDIDHSGGVTYEELVEWIIGDDEETEYELEEEHLHDLLEAPKPDRIAAIKPPNVMEVRSSPLAPSTPDDASVLHARISLAGQPGTVRFVGETEFASGTWMGIELDRPFGKNNGSVNGVNYFDCPDYHGIFVREEVVADMMNGNDLDGSGFMPVCAGCAIAVATQEELLADSTTGKWYCLVCWNKFIAPCSPFQEEATALVPIRVCDTWTESALAQAWTQDPLVDWPPAIIEHKPAPLPTSNADQWASVSVCVRSSIVGQHGRDGFDVSKLQHGDSLRSRYMIRSELGVGTYAKALLAEDKKTRALVCIKQYNSLSIEALADFMVIAQRIEEFDPREVFFPRLLDAFFDVFSFTVESLVQGQNCQAMAKIEPGFFDSVRNIQIVACDTCQALKALASAGVVHNDLKADNLMWVKDLTELRRSCVKIVDFGCARLDQQQYDPDRNWALAEGGQGHLGKWPPEMILKIPINHVADVWGLAVTLCELHSSRSMWRDGSDTCEQVLAQQIGLCNLRQGLPRSLLQQSPINVYSFITPAPRHLPVCVDARGKLEVLEPSRWGLDQILGELWERGEKEKFGQFLEQALSMDPRHRPSAADLLDTCSFVKPTNLTFSSTRAKADKVTTPRGGTTPPRVKS